MTSGLDFVKSLVDRLLGVLPADLSVRLGLPVFALVVSVGLVMVVRKAIPALARPLARVLSAAVALFALPFMALLLALARAWRLVRLRPPAWVYHADDALVAVASGSTKAVNGGSEQLRRLARFPTLVVLVVAALLLWRWNVSYCPEGGPACVTPIAQWLESFGAGMPTAPPATTVDPSPAAGP